MLALAGGQGPFWLGLVLVVSTITLAFQLHAFLTGNDDPGWPLIGARTRPGKIAVVAFGSCFVLFSLAGLLWSW